MLRVSHSVPEMSIAGGKRQWFARCQMYAKTYKFQCPLVFFTDSCSKIYGKTNLVNLLHPRPYILMGDPPKYGWGPWNKIYTKGPAVIILSILNAGIQSMTSPIGIGRVKFISLIQSHDNIDNCLNKSFICALFWVYLIMLPLLTCWVDVGVHILILDWWIE